MTQLPPGWNPPRVGQKDAEAAGGRLPSPSFQLRHRTKAKSPRESRPDGLL